MQAGFAMLEAGSVASFGVTNILFKNLMDVVVGAIIYWAVGWSFSYGEGDGNDNDFIGTGNYFLNDLSACRYTEWFYQWTFAATAATIVSGAMAGRTRLTAYLAYTIVIVGFIYPTVVHWTWSGNAWLAEDGYADFAGSGIVHMVGGMVALVGAYFVGPRSDGVHRRFDVNRSEIPGHSMPLVAIGTMILIFGFFGFNGGSVLAYDVDDPTGGQLALGLAVVNTVLSAAGGALAATTMNRVVGSYKWSLMMTCNGAIAGMVSICASANEVYPWAAFVIGFIGGFAYVFWSRLLYRLKIDDAIDAVGVHYGAGFWGLIANAFFNFEKGILYDKDDAGEFLGWQIAGGLVITVWSGGLAVILFGTLNAFGVLRIPDAALQEGVDKHEHGEVAYVFVGGGGISTGIEGDFTAMQKAGVPGSELAPVITGV